MTRKQFYKSKAWLTCRDGYIKSVHGLCERCLKDGKVVTGYIVHHKVYLNDENINNPEVTLNWDNLEYLCFDCHNKEHFKDKIIPRYKVNDDGTVDII